MKSKKTIALFIFSLSLLILGTVRYISINTNVPKEYKVDKYSINENININNISLIINDYKINKREIDIDGDDNYEVILNLSAKNNGNETVSLKSLISNSRLSYGNYYEDYCELEGDIEKITNLSPNDTLNLSLNYSLSKNEIQKNSKDSYYNFYISKEMISNQIEQAINDGYLFGICVTLGGDNEKSK